MRYTAYVYDNGAFQERFQVELDQITTVQQAEETLNDLQVHALTNKDEVIQSYKVNGIWHYFIISGKNPLDSQLKRLCKELKQDIKVIGLSRYSKYEYKYNPDFETVY